MKIVVLGSGMAGISAALAARESSAEVLIIERHTSLGGTAVAGLVGPFMGICGGGQNVIRGNFNRILCRMRDLFPESVEPFQDDLKYGAIRFDPEAMKHTLDVLLEENGISVLLDTNVTGVERTGKRITAVQVFNKSGFSRIEGDLFIDAGGDADLFYRAGLSTAMGRESDGHVQACTLRFIAEGFDTAEEVHTYLDKLDRDPGFCALLEEYGKRFGTDPADMHFQNFCVPGRASALQFNVPRVLVDNPVDGNDLNKAYQAGRKLIRTYLAVLREKIPGAEHAVITNTAEALGIRESRRIIGAYTLSTDDVASGRIFDDSICGNAWMIDIHNPSGKGVLGHTVAAPGQETVSKVRSLYPEGGFHGIPYRCLYTEDCDNLWAAGRCISACHEALAAIRIMPTCIATGEAAGAAAAIAAKNGLTAAQVPVAKLQKKILERDGLIPGINLLK